MNHRIESIVEGIKSIACCCVLKEVKWRVSYFKRIPSATAGMYDHEWTQIEVMAYTRLDAAKKVDPKLKPGYNCWVNKVLGEKP
jgi:hypothetical protein